MARVRRAQARERLDSGLAAAAEQQQGAQPQQPAALPAQHAAGAPPHPSPLPGSPAAAATAAAAASSDIARHPPHHAWAPGGFAHAPAPSPARPVPSTDGPSLGRTPEHSPGPHAHPLPPPPSVAPALPPSGLGTHRGPGGHVGLVQILDLTPEALMSGHSDLPGAVFPPPHAPAARRADPMSGPPPAALWGWQPGGPAGPARSARTVPNAASGAPAAARHPAPSRATAQVSWPEGSGFQGFRVLGF
jgi:hypothetical protein